MKKEIFKMIFVSFFVYSCKSIKPKVYTDEMKSNLEHMFKQDQELQNWNSERINDKMYVDSMNVELEKLCIKNCNIVKAYYLDYSYPILSLNDEKTAKLFWLIVQHSDHDVDFQEKVLKTMKKELKNGNIIKRNYAYLYDRVMFNKGKKQFYGTQIDWSTGKSVLYKIKKPSSKDIRRKEMELNTLNDYLDSFLHNN